MSIDFAELKNWPPPDEAVQVIRSGDGDETRPTSVLVQHSGAPFVLNVNNGPDELPSEGDLREAAFRYLSDIDHFVGLPKSWLSALDPTRSTDTAFGWLPFRPKDEVRSRPSLASTFAVTRKAGVSRTMILAAAEQAATLEIPFVLGSEFGLQCVIHLGPEGGARVPIRITGLSASLPFGPYSPDEGTSDLDALSRTDRRTDFLAAALEDISAALGLDPKTAFIRAVRVERKGPLPGAHELRGRGIPADSGDGADATPLEFIVRRIPESGGWTIVSQTVRPLVACAVPGHARVFRCDPASKGAAGGYRARRPTRDQTALDHYRQDELELVPLDDQGLVTVVQSKFVLGDVPAGGPKSVPLPPLEDPAQAPQIRRNAFSAVSTFRNLRALFERLHLYGMNVDDYFLMCDLPLKGYYRSGVRPGPGKNGDTINGRVQPETWAPDQVSSPATGDRPLLQVHLALGDRSTRHRTAWDPATGEPVRAEPLGFAADPRWIWHEIGHVILMARLGELEFRFAHSMGDALAAIVHDPMSTLARDPDWRGYTFPWVFTPRRHDRCVLHGWGWSGTLGRDLRERSEADRLRMKGYWTEQILSTSLFRLYRCLGGDTLLSNGDPDLPARTRASDVAIFLILQAAKLTVDPRITPTTAESFAGNLSHADEGAVASATSGGDYFGGCATKVVRWAFQAQGMFPKDSTAISDEPGLPPKVDIYIADRRPTHEILQGATVEYGLGSYVPVSLDWGDLVANPPGTTVPAWFASPAGMQVANGQIEVSVGNCGELAAAGTTVTLWQRDWPAAAPTPLWKDAGWVHLATSAQQLVPPGGVAAFTFPAPQPGTRRLILAEATCTGDRAITDPAFQLSCSSSSLVPLNEMVAGDNNIGLMLVD